MNSQLQCARMEKNTCLLNIANQPAHHLMWYNAKEPNPGGSKVTPNQITSGTVLT